MREGHPWTFVPPNIHISTCPFVDLEAENPGTGQLFSPPPQPLLSACPFVDLEAEKPGAG
jgi:hypothetical protein